MNRRPLRIRGFVRAVAAIAILSSIGATAFGPATRTASSRMALPTAPNVVVILTDDQRWDALSRMPTVKSELVNKGVSFANSFVVNSLCCPSRVTFLTGTYSHTNHVYTNFGVHGGWPAFKADGNTVATWLNRADYETALVGKYLNLYKASRFGTYIPPGWDRWITFTEERDRETGGGPQYFDYKLTVDGAIEQHADSRTDYATDVLADHADDFIRTAPVERPLFLYFAPPAPHPPGTPAPRDAGAFGGIHAWRPPSYNEKDVSDKPRYIKKINRFSAKQRRATDKLRRHQLESLLAVDDAVNQLLTALQDTGRLQNTLIVFTSDNGFSWGEHRWVGKEVPYEESIRVPLIMRWDDGGLPAGTTERRFALNLDLAPTIAHAAGVAPRGAEGRSLLAMVQNPGARGRDHFLIEHLGQTDPPPTYCALRSKKALYVRYTHDKNRKAFEELYLLGKDPYERSNVADKPRHHRLLRSMRRTTKHLCQPLPYGMRW
jgi:arylsulfatase A-like enzyme